MTPRIPGLALTVALLATSALCAPARPAQGDWPNLGADDGGTKYSPLTQITPQNVTSLKPAWTFESGDPSVGFRGWEVTPIVVDNVMYLFTTGKKVVALNAESGA